MPDTRMTNERCGICEAGNRDLDILIGSRSLPPYQLTKVTQAYTRLGPWVTHMRGLPDAAAHVAALELPNLSGTAYVRNVLAAISNPRLQDASLSAMRRSVQDDLIASALVLLLADQHIWPLGAHREQAERIASSWGWKDPRPDWPAGKGQHANL